MKFLGDTPDERIPEICDAARRLQLPSVSRIACRGLGVFPARGRPNVLWAGLTNAEPLVQLAGTLDSAMTKLGWGPDRHPFNPHLTLARLKLGMPQPMQALVC